MLVVDNSDSFVVHLLSMSISPKSKNIASSEAADLGITMSGFCNAIFAVNKIGATSLLLVRPFFVSVQMAERYSEMTYLISCPPLCFPSDFHQEHILL